VGEIRRRRLVGEDAVVIADEFGIRQNHVYRVCNKTRRQITEDTGMQVSYFQGAVTRTMNKELEFGEALSNYAMGLGGEVGEVIEPLKKFLYHGHTLDKQKVADELSDLTWYICALANTLEINLAEALERNVEKLRARYPEGFNTTDSVNRRD
jgi:NTP pyrophosphatase (non-canonical NTP hydrolase)